MKQFIITEQQITQIANTIANAPTSIGLPIVDILRSLPEKVEPIKEEEK